jgi:hypothetical protein
MKHFTHSICVLTAVAFALPAFAIDGVTLINQSTVMAAGGFPYVINQTGSYKLSGNLQVTNTTAIQINAAGVALDLNGFTIACSQCSNVPGISSAAVNTVISNGTVAGFGGNGKSLNTGGIYFSLSPARVDHVTIYGSWNGITAAGNVSVSNSSLFNNANVGITGNAVTVANSEISGHGTYGISAAALTMTGSTIANNGAGQGGTAGGVFASTGTIGTSTFLNNVGAAVLGQGLVVVSQSAFYGNSLGMGTGVTAGNNVCQATPGGLC